jgi:hypothetical protein
VAEQERKTKAERRAEARAERKRAEEEAARRAKQQNIRNGVIAVAVIAVLAVVLIPTIQNLLSGGGDNEVTISQEAALEARQSAGCEMVVDGQPLEDSTHHDPATAPPADVLYASSEVRPTHSGPHFAGTQQAIGGVPGDPLDERATTHNLEHGAIIAWFNPDQVDDSTVSDMESWMQARQDLGFESQAGGNIFVSPYPEMTGDKPIAIRAWGFALNCDEWDQDVADAMIIDYWGTHGRAPERNLSPYPTGALGYAEDGAEVQDNTEAPIENESDGGAVDSATEGDTASESASASETEG